MLALTNPRMSSIGGKDLYVSQELRMLTHSSLKSTAYILKFAALIPSQPPERVVKCDRQYSDNEGLVRSLTLSLTSRQIMVLGETWAKVSRTRQNVGLKGIFNKWLLSLVLLLFINMSQLAMHPHSPPSSNWLALRIPFLLSQPFYLFSKLQPASFPSINMLLDNVIHACLPDISTSTSLPHSTSFAN